MATTKKSPPAAPDASVKPAEKPASFGAGAGEHWRGWLAAALLVGFVVGGFALWRHVRGFVLSGADYRLPVEEIAVTPPPPWIHADVRGEAVRNASLEAAPSILEADLAERLSKAFAQHPWVEQVERVVLLHPAGAQVELTYRRPVCMVELPGGGLYPVDAAGVVLPTADFTPVEAQAYPLLVGVATVPVGRVGEPWGDARVAGGAAIAAALIDHWRDLKLARIAPSATPDSQTDDYTYEVISRQGARVVWGRAPGSPGGGEAPPGEKVARLRRYAAEHGDLDSGPSPHVIDVRPQDPSAGAPRTATAPDGTPPK
jgi:hypothetical protein